MTPHQELTATLASTPVLKASFIGVTGPQGPPGPEGPAGPPGPSGSQTPWSTDVDAAGHSLTNAGKVGIGTAAPGAALDINSTTFPLLNLKSTATGANAYTDIELYGADTSAVAYFGLGGNNVGNTLLRNTGFIGMRTANPVGFFTDDACRILIDAAGNVGIGTTAPLGRVDLGSATGVKQLFYSRGSAGYEMGLGVNLGQADGSLSVFMGGAAGASVDFVSPNQAAWPYTSFTSRVTITHAGNVGIGTIAPAHPLDVVGDCNITGSYLKNGSPVAVVTQEQYEALVARVAALEAKLP